MACAFLVAYTPRCHHGLDGSVSIWEHQMSSCACRAPVTLSGMAGTQLLVPPDIAASGLVAHVMAEALLNVPRLLGSLELLGNPAGLVDSLTEGLQDFLSLSLAARSPSTVRRTLLVIAGACLQEPSHHLAGLQLGSWRSSRCTYKIPTYQHISVAHWAKLLILLNPASLNVDLKPN